MKTLLPALRRASAALLLAFALAAPSCASPLSVEPAPARAVYARFTDHAVLTNELSDDSRVTLERAGLDDDWAADPAAAMKELHALALQGDFRERLAALAEAGYLLGERTGDRSWFAASACYAHLFLFGDGPEDRPGPFRRRFRRAADIYNVSLALAFTDPADGGQFVPPSGRVALPTGAIDIAPPRLPLQVAGFAYEQMRPAITMGISGFRSRDVSSGVGAPLVAMRVPKEGLAERKAHLAPTSALAVSAYLRVEGTLEEMGAGGLRGSFEFLRPTEKRRVRIGKDEVPVEFDTTAALAWELNETRPWEKEIGAFLDTDEAEVDNRVYLTKPYERGKVPIVFVHGTASSPARWAEILNELHSDGRIHANCQFWIYQYGSGAPILVSAAGLRAALARVVRDVDPDGEDEALRSMVVVGHSQGGLLTRLQATASGERFWSYMSDQPFADLGLSDSERRYMGPVFFFEPNPYVKRVVFLATPHQGSYVAGNWIGKIGASLVSLPRRVTRGAGRLAKRALGAGTGLRLENLSNAVDDMDPESPFVDALRGAERAKGVPFHSIVAVDGAAAMRASGEGFDEGDDGVVAFPSAHLDDAASEVVVDSAHSCQSHAATVAEIRRIVRLHLDALGR
ncbi:MAG: hypothetical protein HMLKMBBP_03255 [Planctomycetes bacterium]|nr:hypothetical protein [Planctomycetota bacterium]